ncbi:hypothetical protein D3H59_08055 [Micromonospora endophytica]|nr:hypothetical protein D3H59_08055 [Micromonospora endophytica]
MRRPRRRVRDRCRGVHRRTRPGDPAPAAATTGSWRAGRCAAACAAPRSRRRRPTPAGSGRRPAPPDRRRRAGRAGPRGRSARIGW